MRSEVMTTGSAVLEVAASDVSAEVNMDRSEVWQSAVYLAMTPCGKRKPENSPDEEPNSRVLAL